MSCYLLPKGIIDHITANLARFWWKNQETGKGIHWKTWDILAKKKEEGGINFRHLEGFNLALLSKQLWRLCNHPQSVLARTLQAKYYPRESSAFHGKLGTRPSYGWRSIMESKKLLSLGLKREFGNGLSIDLQRDPWLVDGSPRGARSLIEPFPTLAQLKDQDSDEWNFQNLQRYFDHRECQQILQVKPGGHESKSSFSWIFNNSGIYSVKSGYWVWSSSSLNTNRATEQQPNYSSIYSEIWRTETSNKIRHFLWRCLSKSLPVHHELYKRRIRDGAECPLCGHEQEDINHLLFNCDLAREVWELADHDTLSRLSSSEATAVNLWECLNLPLDRTQSQQAPGIKSYWPWLLWRLWKSRNEFTFQRITTSAYYIKEKAISDYIEWYEHNKRIMRPNVQAPQTDVPQTDAEQWFPPEQSFLKCNVDAAWQDSHDTCGVAWILRDHTGRVRLHGMKSYPKLFSPLEAEASALVWATRCMWNMGYDKVVFESDSSNLINALHHPELWPRLSSFTTDIQGILSRKPWQVSYHHVSRKKNSAADCLAKYALSFPLYFGSIDNFVPAWLQPSLDG